MGVRCQRRFAHMLVKSRSRIIATANRLCRRPEHCPAMAVSTIEAARNSFRPLVPLNTFEGRADHAHSCIKQDAQRDAVANFVTCALWMQRSRESVKAPRGSGRSEQAIISLIKAACGLTMYRVEAR